MNPTDETQRNTDAPPAASPDVEKRLTEIREAITDFSDWKSCQCDDCRCYVGSHGVDEAASMRNLSALVMPLVESLATAALSPTAGADLLARLGRAEAIASLVPLTADGEPLIGGPYTVWALNAGWQILELKTVPAVDSGAWATLDGSDRWPLYFCYSTREAAEAAAALAPDVRAPLAGREETGEASNNVPE